MSSQQQDELTDLPTKTAGPSDPLTLKTAGAWHHILPSYLLGPFSPIRPDAETAAFVGKHGVQLLMRKTKRLPPLCTWK